MSEEMIVRHCSPTLAGIKTGNLFPCVFASDREMKERLRHWNRALGKKGLRVLPLSVRDRRALLYLYRPSALSRDLAHDTAVRLLKERGYATDAPAQCVHRLICRFLESEEFPHEIGLFLGYPPEDVSGFIENRAGGYKCAGLWKVYGDEAAAKKQFAKYEKCTAVYRAKFAEGRPLDRLTVAG